MLVGNTVMLRFCKISGADPKALADQAGHDIGVSVSVYTQTPIESKLEMVRALEKMILG
jgi:hypothetical protein